MTKKEEEKNKKMVGRCLLEEAEILISRNLNRDYTEHTFFHELMHAVLEAGGSKKTEDEYFVDSTAGLLHQFMKTKSGQLE